jgi:hypothetical protein
MEKTINLRLAKNILKLYFMKMNPALMYHLYDTNNNTSLDSVVWFNWYSIHNDHISYLVYGWWDFCKHGIILKSLLNENTFNWDIFLKNYIFM